jgi:hypothetical protein
MVKRRFMGHFRCTQNESKNIINIALKTLPDQSDECYCYLIFKLRSRRHEDYLSLADNSMTIKDYQTFILKLTHLKTHDLLSSSSAY